MAATPIEWCRIPVEKGDLSQFTRKSDLDVGGHGHFLLPAARFPETAAPPRKR